MAYEVKVSTATSNTAWGTEGAIICTSTTAISYQVTKPSSDTIYQVPRQLPAQSETQIHVGIGNDLTITGTGFTITESGTGIRTA
jgi:hypothetical protein